MFYKKRCFRILFFLPLKSLDLSVVAGTGSKPPLLHGLQRQIRFIPNQIPQTTPRFSIASAVYSEQEG